MPTKPKGVKKQIRSKKDTNRQEIAELRAKNNELQRQVARLQREVERGLPLQHEQEEVTSDVESGNDDTKRCKFCNSADLKTIKNIAGNPVVVLCGTCTRRQNPGKPLE